MDHRAQRAGVSNAKARRKLERAAEQEAAALAAGGAPGKAEPTRVSAPAIKVGGTTDSPKPAKRAKPAKPAPATPAFCEQLDLEALTAKIAEHTKTLETLTGSENKKARAKHYKQLGSLNERLAHLNGSGPAPASAGSATKKPKKKQLSQRQKEQERKNLGLPGKDFSKKKAGSGIPGVRSTQGGGGPTLTPYDLKLYLNEATTPAEILAIVEKYSGTSTPNTASQVPVLQQLQLLLLCSSLTPVSPLANAGHARGGQVLRPHGARLVRAPAGVEHAAAADGAPLLRLPDLAPLESGVGVRQA